MNDKVFQRTFNFYEEIKGFSESIPRNESELECCFVPHGSSDRRNDELKQKSEAEKSAKRNAKSEMQDIYNACSDVSGGAVYLGDGIWITSDGGSHEWGR